MVYAVKGIMQSSTTVSQQTAMVPTGRCHNYIVPVRNPPPCNVAFHQNSLIICLLFAMIEGSSFPLTGSKFVITMVTVKVLLTALYRGTVQLHKVPECLFGLPIHNAIGEVGLLWCMQ